MAGHWHGGAPGGGSLGRVGPRSLGCIPQTTSYALSLFCTVTHHLPERNAASRALYAFPRR